MPARSFRGPLRIGDADDNPEGHPVSLEFTSGAVTDQGDGTFFVDVTYGSTPPSIGGSITSAVPGSVLFVGGTAAAPVFAQDNQGIHYNDAANLLSVFTTLGSEIVTNGTFTGNATGWTVPTGMAYSSNSVSKTSNGTGALVQSITVYNQREYLLTYVVSGWTVGTITPSVGSVTLTAVSANGTYTERFVAQATQASLSFTPTNTARFTIDSVSCKPLIGTSTKANINTGGLSIEGSWSNGSPGTTRAQTFNNDGSYTWTDYRFAGALRASFGANSSGGIDHYTSGGNGVAFYNGNSGLTSNSLYSYNYVSYFYHYGYASFAGNGQFGGSVGAGTGSSTAPTSTLQTAGSTALKVKRITSSQTLDGTATIILADATTVSACTGTPSTATCSSYTGSGQATCESHLPCVWYAGSSCSTYNYESGMGTCSGTSGCSPDTAACSGYDQSSCESNDDAYGGSCAWTLGANTCSSYTDTSSCNGASPCYATLGGDCSTLSDGGGDGSACAAQPDCSYDSGTGACSGYYFTSCDGDNSTYSCTGTYYTGNCSGTYGAACTGTVTCSSYGSSGPCAGETGCTWSSVLNVTLPDGETCPDRYYCIKNDSSGSADVDVLPYPGTTPATTVEKTTKVTLPAYHDAACFAYYKQTYSCSNYTTAGACTPTDCTPMYSNCSYNTGDNICSGDSGSVCSAHNGNQPSCEAQTYFSYCSGIEVQSKNWYVISRS